MTEIIGVRFRADGRTYYFDPHGEKHSVGSMVVVDTANGVECAEVTVANRMVEDEEIVKPLKKVVRAATEDDLKRIEDNRRREEEAFRVCERKILEHNLEMKLVSVETCFDGSKMTFYFTADGRVDFRGLVKDIASHFHTRIELRQIGVRDEAKLLGGLGICGQPFCCARFLDGFQPVSIKMAKEQGLSLNPAKISGTCGRLMCCLKYEHNAYEYLIKLTPRVGALVKTPDGEGTVTDVNLITGKMLVKLTDSEAAPISVHRDDVTVIRGRGKAKKEPDDEPETEEFTDENLMEE